MKGKGLTLIAIVGIALLFASVGLANVPAPAANQTLGFDDKVFNNLTEAECRVCHDGVPDRHHMLYGSSMPVGECSENTGNCLTGSGTSCDSDADCTVGGETCVGTPGYCLAGGGSGDDCVVDADCPAGEACIDNPVGPCFSDADCATPLNLCNIRGQDCPVGLCEDASTPCEVDADCVGILGETCDADACPQSWTGQVCGQPFCLGATAAPNNPNAGVYGCLSCHDESNVGGVISFIVYRDCNVCHVQVTNTPSVHHLDELGTGAKSGDCQTCHGEIVDDILNPPDYIPSYTPSLVTPAPSTHGDAVCDPSGTPCPNGWECNALGEVCVSEPTPAGGCNYCHDAGTDTASGVEVVDNHDTHHGTGVYKNRYGGTADEAICAWCHKTGNPHDNVCSNDMSIECDPADPEAACGAGNECWTGHDADTIRTCENCHGLESLHNIQVDTNGGGVVAGNEDAGYGHIGKDDPGSDSDCWGCHGFSVAADGVVLGSGVPSIGSVVPQSITAGADTVVTITGATFLNGALAVTLTDAADNVITLDPADVTDGAMTVTVNAAAGNYSLQAVKDGEASNAVGISVLPAVAITDIDCSKCLGVMTITGANFAVQPAGTDEDINVTEGGRQLDIIEWSDTEIKAAGARCRGDVTVNSVYGSSQ